ncbi:MAG TPA: hypothetical protein VF582_05610 [Allosphingosinicella sp.]
MITTAAGAPPRISLRNRGSAATALAPLPLATDILTGVEPQPFGREGRCTVRQSGPVVRLRCRPGSSVGGVVLLFAGARLPRGAPLNLVLASEGSPGFKAQVVAKGADAEALRYLTVGATPLPLPSLDEGAEAQLVIVAPAQGGELMLSGAKITPLPAAHGVAEASAWAWDPGRWRDQPAGTIASARTRGIERLFVTLEVGDGGLRHASDLRRFVRMAKASGINVEAVEGDPQMVLAGGLVTAAARARAFAAYQKRARPEERLAGIQYDIEPYVLGAWGRHPVGYSAWARSVLRLRHAAGERIDLVVPFWIAQEEEGRAFLRSVAPAVRILTVMSYRTELPLLTQVAEPLLAWGAAEGVKVRLALEAGALADETEQVFAPARVGTLAVTAGEKPRVMLLKAPGAVAGAQMYAQHSQALIPARRLSFLGNEAAMRDLARRTQPLFSAWPSFGGFAFHGLGWE